MKVPKSRKTSLYSPFSIYENEYFEILQNDKLYFINSFRKALEALLFKRWKSALEENEISAIYFNT